MTNFNSIHPHGQHEYGGASMRCRYCGRLSTGGSWPASESIAAEMLDRAMADEAEYGDDW